MIYKPAIQKHDFPTGTLWYPGTGNKAMDYEHVLIESGHSFQWNCKSSPEDIAMILSSSNYDVMAKKPTSLMWEKHCQKPHMTGNDLYQLSMLTTGVRFIIVITHITEKYRHLSGTPLRF